MDSLITRAEYGEFCKRKEIPIMIYVFEGGSIVYGGDTIAEEQKAQ